MLSLPEDTLVYLIGSEYSGHKKCIFLIFYEPIENRLYGWYGNGHEPYCLTNLSPMDLEKNPLIKTHSSIKGMSLVNKYDALRDESVWVTKITTTDPRAIGGGKESENIRDIIPNTSPNGKVWEAKISYDCCYIYDNELEIGMPYILRNNKLIPESIPEIQKNISDVAKKVNVSNDNDERSRQYRWISLLEYPVPEFLRCALDIEVMTKGATRVPDYNKVEYPIISASLVGSDGMDKVFMLLRDGIEIGEEDADTTIEFFDKEEDLVRALFNAMVKYPFIITFNGDNFDLPYIHNRAIKKLGFTDTPIRMGHHKIGIRDAIHIDLYRFFFNKSIKNYAFGGKYKNITLDSIATALIGESKIKIDYRMENLSYNELARYNSKDGKITLKLTTYDDDLVMKLIVVMSRIASMSIEELIRFPISQWIRGMMFYEHRKRNILIPNKNDLIALKGQISTKAIVKGKKYKGAVVVDPKAGIHFNTKVMDFASLYPSIFKVKNLGYSTVRCFHEECKDNIVPETSNWICKKNKAIEGDIIGFLKDLRVTHYKKLKKENSWYNVVEQAIKVFLNATYGVFGDDKFDLYCPPVSESITAIGRNSIILTIKEATRLGIEVLYGDTDSVFLREPTDEQIEALSEWSFKNLGLDLEVDKVYRYVCMSSRKKNYLGVFMDGGVDVKGLTGKKKHMPVIIKDAFTKTKKFFSNAKTPEDVEAIKSDINKIVRDTYFKIKRRDFEMSEIAYHFTLGKSPNMYDKTMPQHVKASIILREENGIFLKKGDVISFVKVKSKWYNPDTKKQEETNVRPLESAEKDVVDIDKYHELLKSTFGQILDCLNLDFNSIIGITNLEQFME